MPERFTAQGLGRETRRHGETPFAVQSGAKIHVVPPHTSQHRCKHRLHRGPELPSRLGHEDGTLTDRAVYPQVTTTSDLAETYVLQTDQTSRRQLILPHR